MTMIKSRRTSAGSAGGFALAEVLVTLVVTLVIIGTAVQILVRVGTTYEPQRVRVDARHNARATMDLITRLARVATTIDADPDDNDQYDSIRLSADWNPPNGVVDAYEDVTFTIAGNTVFKREPTDAAPVPIADRIASMALSLEIGP